MKNGIVLFAIIGIAIIVASSFGLSIQPIVPNEIIANIPDAALGSALFFCPIESRVFGPIMESVAPFQQYMSMAFAAGIMLVMAGMAWAFYQNLLKDEFKESLYQGPWRLGKILFWGTVIGTILLHTPNHFRRVTVKNLPGNYVLCEHYEANAKPVKYSAVSGH